MSPLVTEVAVLSPGAAFFFVGHDAPLNNVASRETSDGWVLVGVALRSCRTNGFLRGDFRQAGRFDIRSRASSGTQETEVHSARRSPAIPQPGHRHPAHRDTGFHGFLVESCGFARDSLENNCSKGMRNSLGSSVRILSLG